MSAAASVTVPRAGASSIPHPGGLGNYAAVANAESSSGLIDLFQKSPIESAIINEPQEVVYQPVQSLNNNDYTAPVIFQINSDPGNVNWIVPGLSRITGKVKIVKRADNGTLGADNKVGLIDLAPISFFKEVQLTVQDTLLGESSGSNMAFPEFLSLKCGFSEQSLQQNFASYWPAKDTTGQYDTCTDANLGYKERAKWMASSTEREFSVSINHDLFHSSRLLHPALNYRFKLLRNSDDFILMKPENDEGNYKLYFTEIQLKIYKIKLHPHLHSKIEAKLLTQPMLHPILTSTVRHFPLSANSNSFYIAQILQNKPSSILITFLETDRYFGVSHKNPFKFQPFKIKSVDFYLNNQKMEDAGFHFEGKTNDKRMLDAYSTVMRELGFEGTNTINSISYNDYKQNSFFLYRDLSIAKNLNTLPELFSTNGVMDIAITFGENLPSAVSLLIFATYHSVYSFDKDLTPVLTRF